MTVVPSLVHDLPKFLSLGFRSKMLVATVLLLGLAVSVSASAQGAPKIDCALLGGKTRPDGGCIFPRSTTPTLPTRTRGGPLPSTPPAVPPDLVLVRDRLTAQNKVSWHWSCKAEALVSCDETQDFIVDANADLCTYSMIDNSENGAEPSRPPVVTELAGGIRLKRYVHGGGIWGGNGWFDATVTVGVVPKDFPANRRAELCVGNISGIKRADAERLWKIVSYCGSSDALPSGWLLVGYIRDPKCGDTGVNAVRGLQEASVQSGAMVLVCWQQDAPSGWDDLGLVRGDGACGSTRSGQLVRQRKIRKR